MKWYYAFEGRPVGPVDEAEIRSQAAGGRITPATLVWHDGMEEWEPYAQISMPEPEPAEPPPFAPVEPEPGTELAPPLFDPTPALAGETRFSIRDCFARGWDVVAARPVLTIAGLALYLVFYLITSFLGIIGALIAMPYFAGLYGVYLRIARGQESFWSDLWIPYSRNLVNVILVQLLPGLLFFLLLSPFEKIRSITIAGAQIPALDYDFSPLGIACLLFALYLGISWFFALPLVVDHGLKFWEAISLSHRVVKHHFLKLFVFATLCFLFTILGMAIFYVGFLLTATISLAAVVSAYDSLFNQAGSGARPPASPSAGATPSDSPQE